MQAVSGRHSCLWVGEVRPTTHAEELVVGIRPFGFILFIQFQASWTVSVGSESDVPASASLRRCLPGRMGWGPHPSPRPPVHRAAAPGGPLALPWFEATPPFPSQLGVWAGTARTAQQCPLTVCPTLRSHKTQAEEKGYTVTHVLSQVFSNNQLPPWKRDLLSSSRSKSDLELLGVWHVPRVGHTTPYLILITPASPR